MFKRENRLIPGIRFSNSRLVVCSEFVLKEKKNELPVNRFGIVVSKKIDKRAVARNAIKRMLRTAIMNLYGKMSVGHDILLIVKKGVVGKTKEENLLTIETSFKKAGIIRIND